jgi:hypothetical protein
MKMRDLASSLVTPSFIIFWTINIAIPRAACNETKCQFVMQVLIQLIIVKVN